VCGKTHIAIFVNFYTSFFHAYFKSFWLHKPGHYVSYREESTYQFFKVF